MALLYENSSSLARTRLKAEFGSLWESNRERTLRYCYNLVYDKEEAEDLHQEVAFKACRAYPNFRGDSDFKTWIFRIITNTYLSNQKGKKHSPSLECMLNDGFDPISPEEETSPVLLLINSTELETFERAREIFIEQARDTGLQKLQMLEHFELDGIKYKDLATKYNLPIGTVKSRLASVRSALRKIMIELDNSNASISASPPQP